jgi:UDPglucose 6-dehydrogenase
MRITIAGLWHLGLVTAACCAEHFEVTGLDFDDQLIEALGRGEPPISEPGLEDLLCSALDANSLRFTSDARDACRDADLLWICYDTPVNDEDEPDVEFVLDHVRRCLHHLPEGATVLISSQLPVGTCRRLERELGDRSLSFAYSPENLRLGRALDCFRKPERVVVGPRNGDSKHLLQALFAPFCSNIIWMTPESAEMTKHAINSFLAMSIAFTNEVARLCELLGADAKEVESGLKTEPRIGPLAYVGPGGAVAGGTLARDVRFLVGLAESLGEPLPLLSASIESNRRHKLWPVLTLARALGDLAGARVAILGLTYKPGTNTLRRSSSLELCQELLERGSLVRAYDPVITALPDRFAAVELVAGAAEAIDGADAVVICTEWPEFRSIDWPGCLSTMRRPLVIDVNRFLGGALRSLGSEYRAVGLPI